MIKKIFLNTFKKMELVKYCFNASNLDFKKIKELTYQNIDNLNFVYIYMNLHHYLYYAKMNH